MLLLDQVSFEINGRKLIRDINLQVRKGEVLALLGANGAGKSTLMHLISGNETPTSGVISLFGKRLKDYDKRSLAKQRAMLTQSLPISMAFSARELVIMGRYPHFRSTPSNHDWEVVDEAMAICGVMDFAERPYLALSGGEQQRVQLARVLAQLWDNPDSLLLLDEPISALDVQYQQRVLSIAKALSRKGFMVILVLHDLNFAARYADRLVMLKNGRKWLEGNPQEVLNAKDIYSVFSVEAQVATDVRSLRPMVLLDELRMDASLFNSKIAAQEDQVGLTDRYNRLVNQHPAWELRDIAAALGIDEVTALSLDSGNRIVWLRNPAEGGWIKTLPLQRMRVRTRNAWCALVTDGRAEWIGNVAGSLRAIALANDTEQLIAFVDNAGCIVREVHFSAEDIRLFNALVTDQQTTVPPGKMKRNTPPPQANALTPDLTPLKHRLIQAADRGEMLEISLFAGTIGHRYEGHATNLVDQGLRYMIKDRGCLLTVNLSRLNAAQLKEERDENRKTQHFELSDRNKESRLHLVVGITINEKII